MTQANPAVDLLRHLFAVAVIAQHMGSAHRYSAATNRSLAEAVDWIDGAVIGFFMISGLLFKPPASWLTYARRQSVRLLLPFFLFSVLYALALAAAGKVGLAHGLMKTLTLQGSSMQLYYLPCLWLVTIGFAGLVGLQLAPTGRLGRSRGLWLAGLILVAAGLALLWPTAISTGSDRRLLPLYLCAFLIGHAIRQAAQAGRPGWVMAGSFALAVLTGLFDHRFLDLAGVIALLSAAVLIGPRLPDRRLPGSGGVYLLHTPILNFALSTLLLKLSITEGSNLLAALVLTYLISLALTLAVIRWAPRRRWLLLE